MHLTIERDGQQSIATVTPRKVIESNAIDSVERGQIGIQPIRKPAVLGVPPGSSAAQAGLHSFDRILSINGTPIADEAALHETLARAQGTLDVVVHRAQRVEAGAVAGNVPTVVKLSVPRQPGKDGFSSLGAEPSDLYVATVIPGSVADKAGLKEGDQLVSLNGQPLRSFNVMAGELSTLKEKPFELSWRSLADGQTHTQSLAQATHTTKDEMGQEYSRLELGVRPWFPSSAELLPLDTVTVHLGVGEALKAACTVVPKIIGQMVKVIGGLVSGQVSPKTLGGPVMMYQLSSRSAEQGMDSFLHLMAVISINLGVMNLLPIPILDGFHLLAAFWEAIRRRPISVRAREVANVVGLVLLWR